MSELSIELLQSNPRQNRRRSDSMRKLCDRLVREHGTPTLGNYRDPIKEIFYILLSAKTTDALYRRAHKNLFAAFGCVEAIAAAPRKEVLRCIGCAGLGAKRSDQVIATAKRLTADLGRRPAAKLKRMDARRAYRYLTGLPGIGPKSALCIMMYSLDFDVFPVDVNVQRVSERVGLIRKGLKHYQSQKILPKYAPDGRSRELHISMVTHGRTICLPIDPKCNICCIGKLCRYAKARAD